MLYPLDPETLDFLVNVQRFLRHFLQLMLFCLIVVAHLLPLDPLLLVASKEFILKYSAPVVVQIAINDDPLLLLILNLVNEANGAVLRPLCSLILVELFQSLPFLLLIDICGQFFHFFALLEIEDGALIDLRAVIVVPVVMMIVAIFLCRAGLQRWASSCVFSGLHSLIIMPPLLGKQFQLRRRLRDHLQILERPPADLLPIPLRRT